MLLLLRPSALSQALYLLLMRGRQDLTQLTGHGPDTRRSIRWIYWAGAGRQS